MLFLLIILLCNTSFTICSQSAHPQNKAHTLGLIRRSMPYSLTNNKSDDLYQNIKRKTTEAYAAAQAMKDLEQSTVTIPKNGPIRRFPLPPQKQQDSPQTDDDQLYDSLSGQTIRNRKRTGAIRRQLQSLNPNEDTRRQYLTDFKLTASPPADVLPDITKKKTYALLYIDHQKRSRVCHQGHDATQARQDLQKIIAKRAATEKNQNQQTSGKNQS